MLLTVTQAIRYGETRGLGGSVRLAIQVASGRLGQKIERAEFWRTVLLFFVNHPEMGRIGWVTGKSSFVVKLSVDAASRVSQHGAIMSEMQNQFSLTRLLVCS